MLRITAEQIIEKFDLAPLNYEGGLFRQTYLSEIKIPQANLPTLYKGDRVISTQIYYLLTDAADSFSALHRLLGDEVYHFYLGDPIEMLLLFPDGSARVVFLGQDILNGEEVQFVVPRHTWQGFKLKTGGKFAFLGTSMSPGFDWADFELGDQKALSETYPDRIDLIRRLTRT